MIRVAKPLVGMSAQLAPLAYKVVLPRKFEVPTLVAGVMTKKFANAGNAPVVEAARRMAGSAHFAKNLEALSKSQSALGNAIAKKFTHAATAPVAEAARRIVEGSTVKNLEAITKAHAVITDEIAKKVTNIASGPAVEAARRISANFAEISTKLDLRPLLTAQVSSALAKSVLLTEGFAASLAPVSGVQRLVVESIATSISSSAAVAVLPKFQLSELLVDSLKAASKEALVETKSDYALREVGTAECSDEEGIVEQTEYYASLLLAICVATAFYVEPQMADKLLVIAKSTWETGLVALDLLAEGYASLGERLPDTKLLTWLTFFAGILSWVRPRHQ